MPESSFFKVRPHSPSEVVLTVATVSNTYDIQDNFFVCQYFFDKNFTAFRTRSNMFQSREFFNFDRFEKYFGYIFKKYLKSQK